MDDLDSENNPSLTNSQQVRKNISLKLKEKGRRGKKRAAKKELAEDEEEQIKSSTQEEAPEVKEEKLTDDIPQPPTLNILERANNEPLHQNKPLRWDHKVNLIGEKMVSPNIHLCASCMRPILLYGRMIPCKHVTCYECITKAGSTCPRCKEKIEKTMQFPIGQLYFCNHGGSKHGIGGCSRTYLSDRDLHAHQKHRHNKSNSAPAARDPRTIITHSSEHTVSPKPSHIVAPVSSPPPRSVATIPVVATRNSNLITVPIQDDYSSSILPPAAPHQSAVATTMYPPPPPPPHHHPYPTANFSQPPPSHIPMPPYSAPPPPMMPRPMTHYIHRYPTTTAYDSPPPHWPPSGPPRHLQPPPQEAPHPTYSRTYY